MFGSVLVVCMGNICRSPMGAALLAGQARERRVRMRVESAGIRAVVGAPADEIAVELMREQGVDIRAHRGRQLTPALMSAFELVLVMNAEQQRLVEATYPTSRGRVHRLGRSVKVDVPDPYLQGRPAFERARELIERGIGDMAPLFWADALKSRSP